ncbi:hypothetical protein [Actinomadura bangladeshensis]|uniref:hypothetical protein n=1 Tax=Actinomadura bangladeshensis TaxID=453573 RepID=UPI001A9F21FC|nr:hypothetical protein [Actinomadura bangladeshensis]
MNPLIRGLFKKFREEEELTALKDSDAFELFSAALILPDTVLSQAEMSDFLLDTGAIGIDVVALEANGRLVWDSEDVRSICEHASKIDVTLYFIQAKQSPSIVSAEILAFGEAVKKFLNGGKFPDYPRLNAMAELSV